MFDDYRPLFNEIIVSLQPKSQYCPRCGGRVFLLPACPGYGKPGDGRGVMVCHPESDCGNAVRAECAQSLVDEENGIDHGDGHENCHWKYQHPMNEYRSDYAENEKNRPAWANEVPEFAG